MKHFSLLAEKGKDGMILRINRHFNSDFSTSPDDKSVFYAGHTGTSMNPTLSEEDVLEVTPYTDSDIRTGDVIYFRAPGKGPHIVHRVVRVCDGGIATRGDNSRQDDAWLLAKEDVLGRVTAAWRGRKRRSVAGGMSGLVSAHILRLRRSARQWYSIPLRPLYRLTVKSDMLHMVIPKKLRPHIISFESSGVRHVKLISGRRVIGRYDHATRNWKISPFIRPFIREGDLLKARGDDISG
jgi:signal peptidase I